MNFWRQRQRFFTENYKEHGNVGPTRWPGVDARQRWLYMKVPLHNGKKHPDKIHINYVTQIKQFNVSRRFLKILAIRSTTYVFFAQFKNHDYLSFVRKTAVYDYIFLYISETNNGVRRGCVVYMLEIAWRCKYVSSKVQVMSIIWSLVFCSRIVYIYICCSLMALVPHKSNKHQL